MTNFNLLLSEVLRPQTLADLTLPEQRIESFERMVRKGSILNMIFHGKPGIGKTSAARILIRELEADCYELNGSLCGGDKSTARDIEEFASTMSLTDSPKIVFIDEADYLSEKVQASLLGVIEKVQHSTRFILTANDIKKMTPAIQSRCIPVTFDVGAIDASSVMGKMVDRYVARLGEMGHSPDPKRLREIVGIYFPDLRNIANHLEFEFG